MSLSLKWLGKESAEVVGRTRALCYAPAGRDVAAHQQRLAVDGRVTGDDLLLAERDGAAVGTATSYSLNMWARGQSFPCQGVGWVGTIKTHRRSGGVASQVMREVLRKGRERGDVVSALMPFRGSYYQHFGYGFVERRSTWTLPLAVLPTGDADGFSFAAEADPGRRACRQRMVEAGQCNFERTPGFWEHWAALEQEQGYVVADRGSDGAARSWAAWTQRVDERKDVLVVTELAYESMEALRQLLHFFATLRDQYWAVELTLPADLQLNRLLREPQVPHRLVNHEVPAVRTVTRMQARVLDHARLIAGLRLPPGGRGGVTVAIGETEGGVSTLRIEFDGGRATATPASGAADVECPDHVWAAIVLGDLSASRAAELGIVKAGSPAGVALLDAFSDGPAPFSTEYF